jgi:hypothetical protein
VEESLHFCLPINYNISVSKSQVKFELACLNFTYGQHCARPFTG